MNWFNNLSLRNKILFQAIIILAMMTIVTITVFLGIQGSQEREQWVAHTQEVIGSADALLLSLTDIETGERGFVITGDENFLDPYNQGLKDYSQIMADTQKLVNDNTVQIARLRTVDGEVGAWIETTISSAITLRRKVTAGQAKMEENIALVSSGTGKQRLDKIRQQIAEFRTAENDLLVTRTAESQRSAAVLIMTLVWGTIGAILIGFVMTFIIAAGIARRVGLVARAAGSMAEGRIEARYDMPGGSDEVGQLAEAFSHMATTIRSQMAEQREANDRLRAAAATQVAKDYIEQMVRSYNDFADEVAHGNFTARLSVGTGDDDLTSLGRSLNTMVEGLHTITSQVQQANTNIAAAAAEILAATTQQAASAAEQSAAITQTTTTIEEVKAIAMQTAQQAAQVAHDSQNALGIARQGTQSVEETVAGMAQIRTRVETIAQTILGLAEQTQAIGSIITTVSELADQSNLLALNAAIEAARAGEQGKSFAVVAQHVRELAERSKGATSQVREILSDIQRATNAAVLVTEEGTKGVESGAKLAGQAGQMIHRIAGEVEGGSQANVQMAAAAQQQMAGMEQIGQAMGNIQQATTQALASTRQAERAAQDLHTLAQNLQKVVASYRL